VINLRPQDKQLKEFDNMLAEMRPMRGGAGSRSRSSIVSLCAGRLLSFALARPGTVTMALLFGGLTSAVAINALWMQSERHPAPLFHQAAFEAQRHAAPLRKPLNIDPVATQGGDAAAMLPPVRPAEFGRAADLAPTPAVAPKPLAAKRPAKDPIGDIISGGAPSPAALAKPITAKAQPIDKAGAASSNDALAALIERSTKGH
jgi:hypothetical protein